MWLWSVDQQLLATNSEYKRHRLAVNGFWCYYVFQFTRKVVYLSKTHIRTVFWCSPKRNIAKDVTLIVNMVCLEYIENDNQFIVWWTKCFPNATELEECIYPRPIGTERYCRAPRCLSLRLSVYPSVSRHSSRLQNLQLTEKKSSKGWTEIWHAHVSRAPALFIFRSPIVYFPSFS